MRGAARRRDRRLRYHVFPPVVVVVPRAGVARGKETDMTHDVTNERAALEQRLLWLASTIDSVDLAAPDAAGQALGERHPLGKTCGQ